MPDVVTPRLLRAWPLPESRGKDDRGSVLVVGGAASTPGAVLLAGTAALRAGAGRLQLAVAAPVAGALAVAVPEAKVTALPAAAGGAVEASAAGSLYEQATLCDVVLVGPGLDDEDRCAGLLAALLPSLPESALVVLDAFALRALASDPALGEPVAGRLVMTPNASEAQALLPGVDAARIAADPMGCALEVAERYAATASLAGAIATPDGRIWSVEAGSAGLATSGSGDVLAGLVAGMLARSGDAAQAACWGTYVHATAGERLSARVGHLGFLARELLDEAPHVLLELGSR